MEESRERRWTGYFQTCAACGKRNWVRREACVGCGAPLAGTLAPETHPPAFEVGRRTSDRVRGRSLAWAALLGVVLATGAALVVRRVFTTRGIATVPGSQLPVSSAAPALAEERPIPEPEPAFARPEDRRAFEKGRKLLAGGNAKAALAPLSDAARGSPRDPMVAHAYGLALLGAGDRDRALFQLERAARLAPGVQSYRVELARALVAAGQTRRAIREYEALLEREPGNQGHTQVLATLYSQTGQGARASDLLGVPPTEASPGTGGTIDLGGAASAEAPRPSTGTVFTNDDLARRRAPAPSPSPSAN